MLLCIATVINISLAFGFALLQLALTLGAPLGKYALDGMHRILPPSMRLVSGLFSGLWILVGISCLQKAEILAPVLHDAFVTVLLFILLYFLHMPSLETA